MCDCYQRAMHEREKTMLVLLHEVKAGDKIWLTGFPGSPNWRACVVKKVGPKTVEFEPNTAMVGKPVRERLTENDLTFQGAALNLEDALKLYEKNVNQTIARHELACAALRRSLNEVREAALEARIAARAAEAAQDA